MLGARFDVNGAPGRAFRLGRVLEVTFRDELRRQGAALSRVAIIGSCITRDLWPILGEAPGPLLYVSRTSLASLFAAPPSGVAIADPPPNGLKAQPHAALVADLKKTALASLVAFRPTHIILDFIDERFDLLATADGGVAVHSWELDVSGYLEQAGLSDARQIPRLSPACERLWRDGAAELVALLAATPLRDAKVVLHEAQWAQRYLDAAGEMQTFHPLVDVLSARMTDLHAQNTMLSRYQQAFRSLAPHALRVCASDAVRIADANHRWGLSPFHYVDGYYREIRSQLGALGV